ncbi:MAG: hypothetical protein GY863_24060 [bacterium]|nr:hypothetical protein [bacterium]
MTRKLCMILILVLTLNSEYLFAQEKTLEFTNLKGPYLGQKPPGLKPELFAPGIYNTEDIEGCSGFLNNGTVFVFNRRIRGDTTSIFTQIYVMELNNGKWTKPYPAPFQKGQDDDNFTVGPDGQTLYLQSTRSRDGSRNISEDGNIWTVRKTSDGWTKPEMLSSPAFLEVWECYPSITNSGTLYFFNGQRPGLGKWDIFYSRLENGKYQKAENMGGMINSEHYELDSFVAPDESYLIVCSDRPGRDHNYDLYISFLKQDGSWTSLINMGREINEPGSITRPSVTPDGEYLFYCKGYDNGNEEIFWVSSKLIENLKPDSLR